MIGIMDWGIGGLSVYRELRRQNPAADVLYFSDSGSTPYGKLSKLEMRERFQTIAKFFKSKGVSQVLVACNAASSALDFDLESFDGVSFQSIIPAGISTVKLRGTEKIGVIGGLLTISSGIYQRRLNDQNCKFLATQVLSAFVEDGMLEGVEVERSVKEFLDQLGDIDSLLLACTHYPALTPAIAKIRPNLQILDPAGEMVKGLKFSGNGIFEFITTGDLERAKKIAPRAFGIELGKAAVIALR